MGEGGKQGKEEGLGKGRTWSMIVSMKTSVITMKCFEPGMVLWSFFEFGHGV